MASELPANPTLETAPLAAISLRHVPKHKFEGHHISGFVFLHDNIHIVSGSIDGTMRKWNFETGLLVGDPWKGEGGGIWTLALSPDGKTIACGTMDGSVQTWNTNGEMVKGDWTAHSDAVWSLSWSPSGGHLASGSGDGKILIRKAGSGGVRSIETNQHWVCSLAHSPSGDRIASGGYNKTICIWDGDTGKLLVGPIKDLEYRVDSVVWSSDSNKLYFASDKFAYVLDSITGTELHRFQHHDLLYSIAHSPKHNLLACVGVRGIAQLWDTESYQTLGDSFHEENHEYLYYVSFSRDGQYLAYGGSDKIILWIVQDEGTTHQEGLSSSRFDVDATKPFAQLGADYIAEEEHDNPYNDFFQSEPYPPLQSSQRSHSLPARRLWNALTPSRYRPAEQPIPQQPRIKRSFFAWHTESQPITASTAKPKNGRKLHWMTPRPDPVLPAHQRTDKAHRDTNSQTVQSSSAAAQPSSASQSQHLQTQNATLPAEQEYDYGCWSHFWLSLTSHHPRPAVSATHSTASQL